MIEKITYISKFDGTPQPAMCQAAGSVSEARPLLVALHTWSFTYEADCSDYAALCARNDWHMIFPHFRGPNWHPDACGSDLVVSDLEDAVAFMCEHHRVDPRRIYLVGGSGGGHCGLLMAGRRPDLWSAVSVWCPISDLALWCRQSRERNNSYADNIIRSCGGDPEDSAAARREARLRSPLTWLKNAVGRIPVDINTGIHDGHTGSVPVGQAIRAYNMLAAEADRISEADIEYIEKTETVPAHLAAATSDPAFGPYTVYLRKHSGCVRLTLFEGGHDIMPEISGEWLARQTGGAAPDWGPGRPLEARMSELSK